MRIAHLCILHRPLDARVFCKQCRTLAAAGHDVHLIVPDPPARRLDGVSFHAVGRPSPRASSVLASLTQALRLAIRLRADVYHVHEAVLIPVAVALKLAGARVVYDVHEDAAGDAKSVGTNLNSPLLGAALYVLWSAMWTVARGAFDAYVSATGAIARKYPAGRTIVVRNYPVPDEFDGDGPPFTDRPNRIIHVGGMTAVRGIGEMVQAVGRLDEALDARLVLVGGFSPVSLEAQVRRMPGSGRVEIIDWQDRAGMIRQMRRARVGVVLFHPDPNHVEALPNKLFEYMAAGLPVVASDFPLWRRIVGAADCGILVDPLKPDDIAEAIGYLLSRPAEAEGMGRRGQAAVRDRYHWSGEGAKLIDLYRRLDRRGGRGERGTDR